MFYDRVDAGKKLGKALKAYSGKKNVIVLAIPRGGVEVGLWVSRALKAKFSLLIVRKLPLPYNLEAGFGAIAEDGTTYVQDDASMWISKDDIKRIKSEQKEVIKERLKLRNGHLPSLNGKTVVLVDDGIAMGSTIIAGVKACKKLGAKKVIVGAPVAGKESALKIADLCDELIILETPNEFQAVAQAYYKWRDVTDDEVLKLMKKVK